MGTKILYDEQQAVIDPFSPENVLLFATGPPDRKKTPSSGRHLIVSKARQPEAQPLQVPVGHGAVELKKAGYAAIVVKGKPEQPTSLNLNVPWT